MHDVDRVDRQVGNNHRRSGSDKNHRHQPARWYAVKVTRVPKDQQHYCGRAEHDEEDMPMRLRIIATSLFLRGPLQVTVQVDDDEYG